MKIEDLRAFFVQRMAEIMHKDTLDSYRVRSHNAYTLLKESLEVVDGWNKANVKDFDTVSLCLEETIDAMNEDNCLSYSCCAKEIIIEELNTYKKGGKDKKDSAEKIVFIITQLIKENECSYLDKLFCKISDILLQDKIEQLDDSEFIPTIEVLDSYITAFASQLIHKGFSKIYLYQRIQSVMMDESHSYEERIEYLRKRLCRRTPYTSDVIFKIDCTKKHKWIQGILELKDRIPERLINEEIKTKNKNFVSPTISSKFFIYHSSNAWDSISAIKSAREFLSLKLDALHLGQNNIDIEIPNKALVVSVNSNDSIHWNFGTEYILDGDYDCDEKVVKNILDDIDHIRNSNNIDNDIKDRLNNALRHLRIGNSQKELEQRFINYWIALEFIFSSPAVSGSTFTRLKANLTNILTACYMKRNVLFLNKLLTKNDTIKRGEKIWEMSEADYDQVVNKQPTVLMKYRTMRMKSKLFGNSEKRKKYIGKHEKNIYYHIARIYRMRNELIHEAALKQDIENVTSNLRYYLVFLLSQMIHYYAVECDNQEHVSMNQFFYFYETKKLIVNRYYNLIDIMNVPIDFRLVD